MFEVYEVILRKLAEVHRIVLGDGELPAMHDSTQSYWQEVVSAVCDDVRKFHCSLCKQV